MLTWIRHNQGLFVGVLCAIALLIWTFGCQSTTTSLISDVKVTRAELTIELNSEAARLGAELDTLQEQGAMKKAQLDQQDDLKRKLYEFAAITATSGTFNPMGIITLVGSILGVGVVVDNRIKDKVIANRPLPISKDNKTTKKG